MNILHTEWSGGWGGQEQRIVLESVLFTKRGHRVYLATPSSTSILHRAQAQGIPVTLIPFKGSFDLESILALRRFVKKNAIDVVITHSSVDSWVAAFALMGLRKVALIRTRHLSIPPSSHFFNRIYHRPALVVTTADSIVQLLIDRLGVPKKKIVSVPTGVDLSRFDSHISGESMRQELGLNSGHFILVYAAVLRSWKRHDLVLKAFKQVLDKIPKARLVIAGGGPKEEEIRKLVRELDIEKQVFLLGHREDVPQVIAAADVCLLASDKGEGVPQAVVQYMAMRKPVVATDVGGVRELVFPGETGWLVKPGSVGAFAEALIESSRNREQAGKFAQRGRENVEKKWTADLMADQLERLYGHCVETRQRT